MSDQINDDKKGEADFFQQLSYYFRLYKIPLILVLSAIVFLSIAAVLLVRESVSTPEVVFTNEASSKAQIKIKVDIEGSVEKPGVYEVSDGTRIHDVLVLAGGLKSEADKVWVEKYLNKAAKVTDGGKIYIPSRLKNESNNPITNNQFPISNMQSNLLGVSEGLININTASSSELDKLPGVGEVTADKIIANRPYDKAEELKTRKVVGSAVFEKIKNLITIY